MCNAYAGVGSRSTPPDVLKSMSAIAVTLAQSGWTLRSGGAEGADTAFEQGCDKHNGLKEIYLPWRQYNQNESLLYPPSADARKIAQELFPAWSYVKEPVRLLMSRNVHQVLGRNLDAPVDFLVCYTPDGCTTVEGYGSKTGGTGMAIALASVFNIPVFNLQLIDVVSFDVVAYANGVVA